MTLCLLMLVESPHLNQINKGWQSGLEGKKKWGNVRRNEGKTGEKKCIHDVSDISSM